MELPDWIPLEAWNAWVDMRKKKKKPLNTDRAINMAINKLESLMNQGHNPEEVLDQSTFNNWQGLFPVKDNERNQGSNRISSGAVSRADEARAELDNLFGKNGSSPQGDGDANKLRLVK